MLERLTVRNIGLMKCEEVRFSAGFNVITGESGSGKSVLLAALRFVLGSARLAAPIPDPSLPARVEAEFQLEAQGYEVLALEALGYPPRDRIVLAREVDPRGKSRATINGEKVSLRGLAEVGERLLSNSAQGQNLLFKQPRAQLALLDSALGLNAEAKALSDAFTAWSAMNAHLETALEERARGEARRELLEYQAEELTEVEDLDFDALDERAQALADRKRASDVARALLAELCPTESTSVRQSLGASLRLVHGLPSARSEAVQSHLVEALGHVEETLGELKREIEESRSDSLEFEETRVKSKRVRELGQKYRVLPRELAGLASERRAELEALRRGQAFTDELQKTVGELRQDLTRKARALHERRVQGAPLVEDQIALRLARLGLESATVRVLLEERELGTTGISELTLAFRGHPGAPEVPLGRAASGGELSRVLLSLLLTSRSRPRALVLDEIDAGTGGETNSKIARALAEEGHSTQFIAVTHSPLLAARADVQIAVEKKLLPVARSTVRALNDRERLLELERMLGGGPTAASHARALLGRELRSLRLAAS